MFKSEKIYPFYKDLIGWKQHFNPADISINPALTTSQSGEYYQEKHSALRLDYIQTTLSQDQDLSLYLEEAVKSGINGMFNDLIQHRQVDQYGKTLLEQAQLLNKLSFAGNKIINLSRFVGVQIKLRDVTGLQAVINEIGLQLDGADTVTMYLFHTSQEEPIQTFEVTTTNSSVKWSKVDIELNSHEAEKYHAGAFVLGYYQDDLTASAVNYSNFNWTVGECASCGTNYHQVWQSIRKHFYVFPLYVAFGNYTKGKMFDIQNAFFAEDKSWGLNFKFSVNCDLTEFFIQNRNAFKNLLSTKVAHLILKDMRFSQETNYVQESLRQMVIREVEGDKETNALNISQQYDRELKAVKYNIAGINNRCLGLLDDEYEPVLGVV